MSNPTVLVCARNNDASSFIIKGILKDTQLVLQGLESKIQRTPWRIFNKYYSAEVHLYPFIDGQNVDHINFETVEAVILYVQNDLGESLANAEKRKQLLQLDKSEVNILVCNKCDDAFPRNEVTAWCIHNNFQLVELDEEPDSIDESCPIRDYYGMDRVIHTLHTNTWSNHQLQAERIASIDLVRKENLLSEEDELDHMDQFCKLFFQMSSIKQNASSMQSEVRKTYAEQVVKAFWKAIDGDKSELEDINT